MIKKEKNEWCLYNKAGTKKLGCHPSKAEAQSQEAAVNISKARKAGHRIPKAKGGAVECASRNHKFS